ncbi:hypothetical protein AB0C34_16985 [Nocardia sp. NPDC049220]|uniref:hypothetical protein n=1 Tax=Nocardia sp. NPDC049220 TaxID=3155273 RepID=UPI0033CE39EC
MATTYTAIRLAMEISRCTAVSARHRENATTDANLDNRPLWLASADRHAQRRCMLATKARQMPSAEMRSALDMFGIASILD